MVYSIVVDTCTYVHRYIGKSECKYVKLEIASKIITVIQSQQNNLVFNRKCHCEEQPHLSIIKLNCHLRVSSEVIVVEGSMIF